MLFFNINKIFKKNNLLLNNISFMFKDCRSLDINENIIKSKKGKEDVKNAKNKYRFNFFEYLIKKEIENINIQKQVL